MATLRKDSFTERKPKGERGRGTPFSGIGSTGIKMGHQETAFPAPINDIYGTHIVFGADVENKPED